MVSMRVMSLCAIAMLLSGCLDERASLTYPPETYTYAVIRETDYPDQLRHRLVLAYHVVAETNPVLADPAVAEHTAWVDTWTRAGFWCSDGKVSLYDYRSGALAYSAQAKAGFLWTGRSKALEKTYDALFALLQQRVPPAELEKRAPGLAGKGNVVETLP